jgi:hypothetical protein
LDGRLRSRSGLIESFSVRGEANFTFCFHDSEEVGPAALAKIAKETGLRPEDL